MLPRHASYGAEIVQTLLDNVTSEEFRGRIIIILAGYEEHVTQLFETNPGFQSRFDKMRLNFDAWDARQATSALLNAISRDGKEISSEGAGALESLFRTFSELPNWASARDVMEIILPQMEAERAARSYERNKQQRLLEAATSDKSKALGARGSAARRALPPPIIYELVDVQKVFTVAIASRGGDINNSGESMTLVKKVYGRGPFKEMLKRADKEEKIIVVNFSSKTTCPHCVTFEPVFDAMAEEYRDAKFAVVDSENADDVFHAESIRAVPTIRIYYKGKRQADIQGAKPADVRAEISKIKSQIAKSKANAPPPPPTMVGGAGPRGPTTNLSKREKPPVIAQNSGGNGGDWEDEGDGDETDFWAALEEACAELGGELSKIQAMLEDEANFPPPEIMAIIQRKTGAKNPLKVKTMLQQQRGAVLNKIKISIAAAEKAKSEEEAKIQTALKSLGRCPMGFEWLKEGSGWRCAGGSHFCSDQDLENFMSDDLYWEP